jgi:hypothetical protein
MAAEKYDDQNVLGSKEPAPYATQSSEEDVEIGGPAPLKRALESRHMQMIAIVSLFPSPLELLRKGTNHLMRETHLLGGCYRCWSICWFR